jgi:hypothetical protein
MGTLVHREFTVNSPLDSAWRHLASVERWPSWAKHIKRIEVTPAGAIGPASRGVIHLSIGAKSAFTVVEFNPPRNWKWVGPFLWLTVHYDHVFEELEPRKTKLTWIVEGEGAGASIAGRLFAKIYNRNLDRAIPLLIQEMHAPH